jgi:VPDSG-CTERM motif
MQIEGDPDLKKDRRLRKIITIYMNTKKLLLTVFCVALLATSAAFAGSFTFTASGTGSDGPLSASASFTTSAGTIDITLNNLLANPTSAGQLISDLTFTLGGGTTTGGALGSSAGTEITVNADGTFTTGGTVATGWSLTANDTVTFFLNGLVGGQPQHLIIGPPDGSGLYSAANASIRNFNPQLASGATFQITDANITAATTITSATFSFGTGPETFLPGVPPGVPDSGATVALLGLAMIGLAAFRARFRKA